MTDLLKTASDWLGSMFQTHASRSVTYTRGDNTASISATVGRTVHEVMNSLGIMIATESRDFMFPTSDLVLGSVQSEPQAGDRISDVQGTTTFVYEVMPFGKDSRCFRYCDADHTTLRVHTKEVDRN